MQNSIFHPKIGIFSFLTLLQTLLIQQHTVKAEKQPEFFSNQVSDVLPETTSNISLEVLEKHQIFNIERANQFPVNSGFKILPQTLKEKPKEHISNFSSKAADLLPIIPPKNDLAPTLILEIEKDNQRVNDSDYKDPPYVVPLKKLPTIFTTVSLNNETVNHLTKKVFNSQVVFGDERSLNFYINGTYQIDSQVIQSLSQKNIFTSDLRADYIQLRTVNRERKVSISQSIPQTLKGFETQQTFIGPCELINKNAAVANQQCTFLPPLIVDRNSIEPRFFIPTHIEQMGKIGDVITPETLAIIKQPGWQNVGANGEFTGVDLYFPNIGAIPGNSQSNQTTISRQESIDTTYSLGYYRVRQIVKANAQRAVLGRTIKGIGVIIDDDNLLLNPALGAVAEILPDVEPSLEGLPQDANTNINKNLFNAANNIRIPANSFVIYQAGIGEAQHTNKNPSTSSSTSKKVPSAIFNSIWLGISPVTKRSFSQDFRYVPTGEEEKITRVGGEGGIDSNLSFQLATNENNIASTDLNNFYIQAYISFLQRNVNFVTSNTLTEKTNYYPHISFTGDITNYNSVFRYYLGAIASPQMKFYVGTDYTRNWDNWLLNISAIVYENGDKDYYSRAEGSLSKRFQLNSQTNLGLFTEFRYAWEHNQNDFLDNPVDNFVSLGANIDFNKFSLRVSQLLDLLPNSIGNKLQASFTAVLGSNASFTAYYSPQRNIDSYGISAEYNWRNSAIQSSLSISWSRNNYNFSIDNFGNTLETLNDTLYLLFKTTFK